MNKVIPTDNHVFMSLVGPSGSGKTTLLYKLLTLPVFQPRYQSVSFFYQHYQEAYEKLKRDVSEIEFIQGLDFDLINQSFTHDGKKRLLIFDDFSEEFLKSKDFTRIATAGRHLGLHVLYIKHNLFHKSPIGRDVKLQLTHIVLFQSPRDINQIERLGQQLGKQKFLSLCYKDATSKPFGFLMIDLSPKTLDLLRFCTNLEPTVFYIPSEKARITEIDDDYTTSYYAAAFQESFTGRPVGHVEKM